MFRTSPSSSTQHAGQDIPVLEGQAECRVTDTITPTPINPFIHLPMMPQFNPLYYWTYFLNPHPIQIPFAHFPIGPYLQAYPIYAPPWYSFQQQAMMSAYPYPQPIPFGIPPPGVTSPIAQNANAGYGTSITNSIVTFNEDNSTKLKIQKNRHHNTGSD